MVSRAPTLTWLLAILIPLAGWMILTEVPPARMNTLWLLHFTEAKRERLFVASLAFFVSFGTLRGITYSIHHNAGPFRNIVIRKVHSHHLVWGVLLLLGVGCLWLAQIGLGVGESSRADMLHRYRRYEVGQILQSERRLLPDTAVNAGTCSEMDVRLSCVMLRGAQNAPKWQRSSLPCRQTKADQSYAPNRR